MEGNVPKVSTSQLGSVFYQPLTFGCQENLLGIIWQAEPGGSLGVWELLHPLNKLLTPEKKKSTKQKEGKMREKCHFRQSGLVGRLLT